VKFLPLVWKNIWRRKLRTTFTLACIFIAFILFGILMAIRAAFSIGVQLAGQDRLILIHRVSLILPLPIAYESRIANVPGVTAIAHSTWFGGIYKDPANFFAKMAVVPEEYMAVYPEFRITPEEKKTWLADRQGAIVGKDTAKRFGWKVGDRIPIQGDIYKPKSGDGETWEFNIDGIYDADQGIDKTNLFFHYDYLNENRTFGDGTVGWYIVKIADPKKSAQMAQTFDDLFENSPAETKTTTEKGFVDGFAKQIGDIGLIMMAILGAVLFTILLVVGNTMMQSVRERTNELAVLKTLGFSNVAVLAIVLGESLFVAALGGGVGLLVAWAFVQRGDPTGGALPAWFLPPKDIVTGVWLIAALGLAAGALPAMQAMRLRITDALRRN
jgi:putative ABC transport system permease protein